MADQERPIDALIRLLAERAVDDYLTGKSLPGAADAGEATKPVALPEQHRAA